MNSLKSLSRFSFIISLTLIFAIALAWIAFDRQVSSQSLPPQTAARPDAAGGPALDFDLLKRLPAGERELPASRYQAARALACRRVSGPLLEKQSGAAEWTNLGPERSAVDPCSQAKEDYFQRPFDVSAGAVEFRAGAVYPNGLTILAGSGQGVWRGERGYWKEILAGPSGFVAINRDDRQIIYAAQEGLALKKSDDGGRNFFDAAKGIDDAGLFIAPFAMDPNDPQRLWTGGRGLWRTSDGANQWTRASAAIPGSKDARVSAIAIAPHDFNLVLAGTSEGRILRSNAALRADSTTDWSSVQPRRGFVSSIAFDPIVENRIYSTYSTFGGAHVWRSDDGGASWTALDGDSLPDLPVHALAIDPRNPARLFIGTDLGVFISMDGGSSWIGARGGFGAAAVESLTVHQASDEAWLYAFTRGHGVWRLALHQTTQTEPAQTCTYAIAPDAMSFGPAATTGFVVRVTATGTNCSWSASSDAPWATFTTTFPVVGTGEARFNVAANATAQSRAGKLVIAGRDFRIAQAGTGGNCGATPITPGVAIDGALAAGDCPTSRRTVNGLYYADRYSFNGLQGDRIAIVMSSTAFEPDLLLLGPTGALVSEMPGDPANRSLARIPRGGGFFALPAAGAYTIEATSDFAERTGAYRIGLDLVAEQCGTFALSQTIQSFEATGGQGGVQVIGAPGCPWTARINSPDVGWVTIMSGPGGVGSANALFSVAPNTGTAARRADLTIGGRIFTVEQGGIGGACGTRPIVAGATIASSLTSADCGGRERFSFNATPGQAIAVRAASFTPNFFPVITLLNANGTSLATAGGLLPSTGGVFNIPAGGPYTIEIGTSGGLVFGDYAITLFSPPSGCGYTVLPATTTFSQAAAQSGIAITTNGTCPWLAVSDANWITINSASTGTGNGEVKFSVAENTTDLSRRGSVTISGRIVTIDQAGRSGACATGTITAGQTVSGTIAQADCLSYFVAGTGATTRYADRFRFTGKAGDRVSALEISRQSNPAVTLADGNSNVLAQGTGGFSVAALPADGDYTIEIANVASATAAPLAYAVTLSSVLPGCTYSIAPFQQRFEASGGEGEFKLTATAGCAWRATSGAAWATVDAPGAGSGDGTIKFKVAANTGAATRRTVINAGDRNFTIDQAGTAGGCLPAPIGFNRPVNGSLTAGDCLSQFFPNSSFTNVSDRYSFDATAGEQIAVTAAPSPISGLTSAMPIILNGPSGAIVASASSRLPTSGFVTIPATGAYTIEILSPVTIATNTFLPYTVEVTRIGAGCTIALSSAIARFEAAGGTGKFDVRTAAGCEWTARVLPLDAASWLTIAPAGGTGAGAVDLSVAANTTSTFRRASIVVGDKTFLVDQAGTNGSCTPTPIVAGQSVNGSFTTGDCRDIFNTPLDRYSFAAAAGDQIALRFSGISFLGIVIRDATGATITSTSTFPPSRLPSTGFLSFPRAGTYFIEVGGSAGNSYTLTLEQAPAGCAFELSQTSLNFVAGAGSASLKVVSFGNCPWYAETSTSWVKLDKTSGLGNGEIAVSVEANTTQQSRSGSIFVAGRFIQISQSAPVAPCTSAPIALGQTINGSLNSGECISLRSTTGGSIYYADRYSLNFTEGQQFAIVGASTAFTPYFYVTDANGVLVAQGSPRLPAGTGFLTLPATGAYTIEVTSVNSFSSGAYSIQLAQPAACAFSLLPASRNFEAAGGSGVVRLVTGAACAWTAASNDAWITIASAAQGAGNVEIRLNVAPNTGNNLRRGTVRIGDQQFAVAQAGATGSCAAVPITPDQLVTGSLTRGDCPSITASATDWPYADLYSLSGEAGARYTFAFSSSPSSSLRVAILGPNGLPFADVTNNPTVQLPASGAYTIEISSRNVADYALRLRPASTSTSCVAAFSPQDFPIFESAGGAGSIAVSSLDGCAFTATSNAGWVTVSTGPGKINFSVAENAGEYRTASITIAGQSGVTIRQVGKGSSCLPLPIAPGQAAAGALNRFDCQTSGGSAIDRYTFDGKAGDQIALQLLQGTNISTSLLGPSANILLSSAFQSRLPLTGFFVLPATGAYTIELSGSSFSATDYRLLLTMVPGGCAYTLSTASQAFDPVGGTGSVSVKAGGDCPWQVVNPVSWVMLGDGANGKGDGTLSFTVAPTASIFARRATLLIGGQPFLIEQAGLGGTCLPRPIEPGKTIAGTLDESDCFTTNPNTGQMVIYETFTFEGKAGDQLQVELQGVSQPDLALFAPNGAQVSTTQTTGIARFTLPAGGLYRLRAGARGFSTFFTNYQLTLLLNPVNCNFTVSPARRTFEAAGGEVTVMVGAGDGCNWTVSTPPAWITVKPGLSGTGQGTLTLTIAENKEATYRSVALTIASLSVFIEQSGAGSTCNTVPLTVNQTLNGAISRADCQSQRFTTSFADRYTFSAKKGDQFAALLNTFLSIALYAPDGRIVASSPPFSGTTYSRLPIDAEYLTLPADGVYTLELAEFGPESYGLLPLLLPANCSYTLSAARRSFEAAGGTGTVQVLSATGCAWGANVSSVASSSGPSAPPSWITITAGSSGAGTGEVRFTVAANTTANYRSATLNIAGRSFFVEQAGTGGVCGTAAIMPGQTVSGAWATGDCPSRFVPSNTYADVYTFTGTAGARVAITLATQVTSFPGLTLVAPNGSVLRQESTTRLPAGAGFLILPATGTYQIQAGAFNTGAYTLNLNLQPVCSYTVTPSTLIVDAAGGRAAVTVATTNGCDWLAAASATAPWASFAAADGLGSGTGFAQFTVEKNPGAAPRTGTIRVANANITVTQAGPNVSVSSASLRSDELARGSLASAFGVGLATTTQVAAQPAVTVGGTTVKVRDSARVVRDALIFFVSPGQVNYQLPPLTALGKATVLISASNGVVTTGDVEIVAVAPGLFSITADGRGLAAGVALRVRADGTRTFEPIFRLEGSTFVPVPIDLGPETDEVFLIAFGTGIANRSALTAVTAKIGGPNGVDAMVQFAGPQGGTPGFDQVNLKLPRSLAGKGEVEVLVTADNKMSNPVKLSIR